jgi:hypothetical protein
MIRMDHFCKECFDFQNMYNQKDSPKDLSYRPYEK